MRPDQTAEPYWRRREWWARTGRSSLVLFVGTGLGFVTSIVAARAVGPVNYGLLVLATATVASIATFLDFSLEEAVIHYGARLLAEGKPGDLRALLRLSFVLDAVVGGAVFVALMLASAPLARLVSDGQLAPLLVRLAAVEVLATTVNGTTGATLLLGGRPELRATAMAWTTLLRLVSVFVAVRVFSGGAERVLWGYIAGSAVGAVTQFLMARRVARAWGGPRVERRPVSRRRLAAFGLHSSATTTLVALRAGIVVVVLARFVGPLAVGYLSVAMLPVTLAGVATAPIRMMTFPEQAALAAQGRLDVLWHGVRVYTRVALAVGCVAASIGYFLLPWLLPALYSHAFAPAVDAARILLPAAVATLAVAWAKALPAAAGRPEIRTWVSLGELAVTAVAVLLLGRSSAEGAALAISISAVVSGFVWWIVAGRMLSGSRVEQEAS